MSNATSFYWQIFTKILLYYIFDVSHYLSSISASFISGNLPDMNLQCNILNILVSNFDTGETEVSWAHSPSFRADLVFSALVRAFTRPH